MKLSIINQVALAAVGSLITAATSQAQLPVSSYTQNHDDLVLGFTIPPSTGDLAIDLGTATQVGVGGASVVDLNAHGNTGKTAATLLAQLNSLYGNMSSLTWGVAGGHFASASAVYCTVPHGAPPPLLGAAGTLNNAVNAVGFTIDGSGTPSNQQVTDPTAGFGTSWTENIASPTSPWQQYASNPNSTTSSTFATGGIKYQLADLYRQTYNGATSTGLVLLGYFTLGNDGSLTFTPAAPATAPSPTTLAASAVTAGTATLNGSINPNGAATTFSFQFGTNTAYGSATPVVTLASGSTAVPTNAAVSGLLAGRLYHYRVVATNSAGFALGSDMTFTTLAVTPPQLGGLTYYSGGFKFTFTNTPGAFFTVWGATNVALPLNQWSNLGPVAVTGPGQYQFIDTRATNIQQRFYRVTQP
jgi:hypothetical protein